jgi:hypothetical protein
MKTRRVSVAAATVGALLLICLTAAGPVHAETEERSVRSFDGVDVSGPVQVFLTGGDREAVTVTVQGIELERIRTEVSGNKLEVKPNTGAFTSGSPDIRVEVTYTKIRELSVGSGAKLVTKTVLTGDKIDVNVSGGSSAEIKVDVNTLASTVVSGGELSVSGKAKNHELTVNTKGVLSGFNLLCESAFVKIGSGGFAEVNASELIEGSVKSAGGLRFKGEPKKERIETSSGGKAKPAD